jgi:hypothetical protein
MLVDTLLQPLRTEYTERLDKNEWRASQYGAFNAFEADTASNVSILDPMVKDAITQSGLTRQTVNVPVFDRDDVNISNVRSCTVASSENTSKLVTLTFATLAFGFTMYPSRHYGNEMSYQADFNKKMRKYLLAMMAALDTLCVNTMNTNKNVHWTTDITNTYVETGDALQVPLSGHNNFYNNIGAIMEVMDFYGNYNVVGNTMHQTIVNRLKAQGAGNSTNEQWQFPGFNFNFTNRIANQSEVQSTVYLMPEGSVAIANRNDPDSILGQKTTKGHEFSEVVMPMLGWNMGSMYYSDCADLSAISPADASLLGLKASVVEGFLFSTEVTLLTAYNSVPATTFSPIVKAELLAGEISS